jgi:hypothetical protein
LENVDAKLDRRNDNRAVEMPPYAQGTSGGKKHRGQEQKTEWGKKKIDDSAYKVSVRRTASTLGLAFVYDWLINWQVNEPMSCW